jgi:hypothetical protein
MTLAQEQKTSKLRGLYTMYRSEIILFCIVCLTVLVFVGILFLATQTPEKAQLEIVG